jgi:hypothetical protein
MPRYFFEEESIMQNEQRPEFWKDFGAGTTNTSSARIAVNTAAVLLVRRWIC